MIPFLYRTRFYYQYSEDRLCTCPLIVHGLLHIPDDILFCGQSGLRSRRFPWANLNKIILHRAYLEQLGARYDLEDELSSPSKPKNSLSSGEYTYDEYPQAILRLPYKKNYMPDEDTRKKAAQYFADILGQRQKDILPLLPEVMPSFGKLRIVDGDSIRTASACGDGSVAERDMSFIRYEIQTRRVVAEPWQSKIFYGRLERVLVSVLGSLSTKKCLMAVITPCRNTQGKDAFLEMTTYRGMGSVIVVDLQCVVAVIGRVETRGSWKIVDRTGGLIHPEFAQSEGVDDDDVDLED
ncbi:hypothetical protein DFH07DRAFT_760513 [Mycena maculata]|uniref:Uncharacterized protein n=1 Tax=Mycena maculata TaxID=230809 RepID=A0AAD7ML51_9AGAR|nr:hypothetical protein DFH07DRAFT_760513 [Mycena maculata]